MRVGVVHAAVAVVWVVGWWRRGVGVVVVVGDAVAGGAEAGGDGQVGAAGCGGEQGEVVGMVREVRIYVGVGGRRGAAAAPAAAVVRRWVHAAAEMRRRWRRRWGLCVGVVLGYG